MYYRAALTDPFRSDQQKKVEQVEVAKTPLNQWSGSQRKAPSLQTIATQKEDYYILLKLFYNIKHQML